MRDLFSDILMHDETLFADESLLDYDYVPEEMPERDAEITEIAESIKPLFSERKAGNLFIFGNPGVGKTASVNFVFNELRKTGGDIIPIYINCWNNQTTHTIALELARIAGLLYPPKGVPTEEIVKSALAKLKEKKGLVICLDEVDRLKDADILYLLINELSNAGLILITNHAEWKEYIEPRLASRLNLRNLEFKDYTEKEMYEILSRRAKMALRPGVIDSEMIKMIASGAGSDVRKGMALLIETARLAEKDASKKILKKHVEEAMSKLKDKVMLELSDEEKKVYDAIKENNGAVSGKIYEVYLENGGKLSMRSFRRYVKSLEKLGIIIAEQTGEGFQGKSRRLWVKNGS